MGRVPHHAGTVRRDGCDTGKWKKSVVLGRERRPFLRGVVNLKSTIATHFTSEMSLFENSRELPSGTAGESGERGKGRSVKSREETGKGCLWRRTGLAAGGGQCAAGGEGRSSFPSKAEIAFLCGMSFLPLLGDQGPARPAGPPLAAGPAEPGGGTIPTQASC